MVKFHTNLFEILKPIWKNLSNYDWVLVDLDFMSDDVLPINFDNDFFILDHDKFEHIYQSSTQIIWGIISAIPTNTTLDHSFISNLSSENQKVWESDQFLIQESFLEIIAFDSSYTIIKFKDENLSNIFQHYFQEQALDLQEFNKKYRA